MCCINHQLSHFFFGGGGRAGKKLQVCPCVTLQSWFCCHSLPFRSIHVGGICVTSRRRGCFVQVRRYSSSACLLCFHVANSGHQTLKYIGESDCCLAYLIFSSTSTQQPVLFATDKDDYCSVEWFRYLDTTISPRICCKLGQCPMAAGIPIDFRCDFRWRQPLNDGLCSNNFAWLLDTVFWDQVQTQADKHNVKENIIWD